MTQKRSVVPGCGCVWLGTEHVRKCAVVERLEAEQQALREQHPRNSKRLDEIRELLSRHEP